MTKQKYKITCYTRKPKPASPAPGIFSFIVLAAAISLPLYGVVYDNRMVGIEHQEADREAQAIMAAMPSLKPLSLKERQSKALKEVYYLSDADIARPVRLWGE